MSDEKPPLSNALKAVERALNMEDKPNVPQTNRPTVSSITTLLDERGKTHGEYSVHAQITQDLKDVMHKTQNWGRLNAVQKETLEMVAHKIGRVLAGNPNFKDHWMDIAGYAKLAEERIR